MSANSVSSLPAEFDLCCNSGCPLSASCARYTPVAPVDRVTRRFQFSHTSPGAWCSRQVKTTAGAA